MRTVAEALERVMRRPARLAQPVGLLRVGGPDDSVAPGGSAGRLGPLQLVGGGRPRQVGLDHQHRRGVAVEAEVVHVVDGARS